jgi:hypothetical protein
MHRRGLRIIRGMDRRLLLSVVAEVLVYLLPDLPVAPETFCDQLAVELSERMTITMEPTNG